MTKSSSDRDRRQALVVQRLETTGRPASGSREAGRSLRGPGADDSDTGLAVVGQASGEVATGGKLLLRVEEAAALLDVGRTRVYDLMKSGALQSVKIGGSRRVPTVALQRYVEELLGDFA